ncbi:MAG: primosomal replication protein N [Limnohabitans sp.]|nr:primosomal replication protein N [Limnohabitans sp.]
MNHLVLTARITETESLRYTPAGLPALDMQLEHASQVDEAGQTRRTELRLRALALGSLAEQLMRLPLGSEAQFSGFLTTPRNGKRPIFHLQAFQTL